MSQRGYRFDSRWLGVIVVMVIATGCTKPTEPSPEVVFTAGFYNLRTVNSVIVPVVTAPKPPNTCPGFTNSGSILLTIDPQNYEARIGTNFDCNAGAGPTFSDTETGTWALAGGPSTFTITFTPSTNKFNLSTASAFGTTLTLKFNAQHQDPGAPTLTLNSTWVR